MPLYGLVTLKSLYLGVDSDTFYAVKICNWIFRIGQITKVSDIRLKTICLERYVKLQNLFLALRALRNRRQLRYSATESSVVCKSVVQTMVHKSPFMDISADTDNVTRKFRQWVWISLRNFLRHRFRLVSWTCLTKTLKLWEEILRRNSEKKLWEKEKL